MAIFRVDSTAVGNGDGTTWEHAFTTLKACLDDAGTVAGSIVYIDDGSTSAYSASTSLTSKGTFAAPINIYSVDKGDDSYSPYVTGTSKATEDTTASIYTIYFDGFANVYGVHFKSGASIRTGTGNKAWTFTDCLLESAWDSASAEIGYDSGDYGFNWRLINTDVKFANVGAGFDLQGSQIFEWYGGALLTTNLTQLVEVNYSVGGTFRIRGVDLSIMTGGHFFNGFGGTNDETTFYGSIIGCKLNGTPPGLVTDTPVVDGAYLEMIDCGSASVPLTAIATSQGDVTTETTVVRTATYDGTNKYSYKAISNVNAAFDTPLRFKLAEVWCSADPTITVECTHDAQGSGAGDYLKDDEWWIEVEQPTSGNASFKQWSRATRMPTLGASNERAAGTSGDWTSGKTDFNKAVADNLAGGAAGVHKVWCCVGVASKTIYVCPKVDVS